MSREIAVFKKPSDIIFKTEPTKMTEIVTVKQAKRGNTFLHRGAICMLSEVSAYQIFQGVDELTITKGAKNLISVMLGQGIFVTNLQTGRTFAVKPDDEIEWIRVTMTVETV